MDTNNTSIELLPEIWNKWQQYLAATFSLVLSEEALRGFHCYFTELLDWNSRMNLVSIRSNEEVLWRHFADALAGTVLIKKLAGNGTIKAIDLGTGAGFPGIPIKIACPNIEITLVESITKKCSFLEHIAQRLNLSGITIKNERAEILGQDKRYRGQHDVVLSRAMTKFSPNLEVAIPLLKKGAVALIYKTERSAFGEEGLPSVERALRLLGGKCIDQFCYALPQEEQKYCILAIQKMTETAASFPRRVGIPEKKPL
jgi:16S rRNA (guanine527-N7)-methyltransferase